MNWEWQGLGGSLCASQTGTQHVWHLMSSEAGFQGGQEPKLTHIGCFQERGRLAKGLHCVGDSSIHHKAVVSMVNEAGSPELSREFRKHLLDCLFVSPVSQSVCSSLIVT